MIKKKRNRAPLEKRKVSLRKRPQVPLRAPPTASVVPVALYTGSIPDIEPCIIATPPVQIWRFENETEAIQYMISEHRLRVHIKRDFTLITFRPQPDSLPTSMPMRIYDWFVQRQ